MGLSPEVKNAIILIIAVSIALKVITPTLVGNAQYQEGSYLQTQYYPSKPLQRDIADTSYSGHLKDKPLAYDIPFPSSRFPESFAADQSPTLYPVQDQYELCNLCTCFTGNYDQRTNNPVNQYSGARSEEECIATCQASSTQFIGLSEEKVACDYLTTR